MPEFLDDPSVLTKDKLKSELLANNVDLPAGNPTKDVYVQLYLKNLTPLNSRGTAMTLDAFSSDEELPPPVVFNRSRSSGKKTSRKQEKVVSKDIDVTLLTDEGLRDELLKHGVEAGPIVASTRKLYERKLQKLLDEDNDDDEELTRPPIVNYIVTDIQVNHNGNSGSDLYSDKEDEVTPEPEPDPEPEPVVEPELVPVVEKPARSRGKTAVTTRTRSSQHQTTVPEDICPAEADQAECDRMFSSPVYTDHMYFSTKLAQLQEEQVAYPKPNQDLNKRPLDLLNTAIHKDKSLTPEMVRHKRKQQKITNFISKQSPKTSGRALPLTKETYVRPVEKIAASEQTPRVEENEVLKELFPNDLNSPSGLSVSCRRPIRGAAGRPVKHSDLWNTENFHFSPKITKTTTSSSSSSYTESRENNRVSSPPVANSSNSSSSSKILAAAPPAGQTKAARSGMSMWKKLLLLVILGAFGFLVYQNMETNSLAPFVETEVAGGGSA